MFTALPGVLFVLADHYVDARSKYYGGKCSDCSLLIFSPFSVLRHALFCYIQVPFSITYWLILLHHLELEEINK